MLPFLFSSQAISAVGKAATQMVNEVRRQFKEIPGIMEGTGKPDYGKAVDISTKAALKGMVIPGVSSWLVPIIIGVLLGPVAVGAVVIGTTLTAVPLALFMNTGGGAWDNAKKYIEAGTLRRQRLTRTRSSSRRRHSRRPTQRHSRTKLTRTHKTAKHTVHRLHPAVHQPTRSHLSGPKGKLFFSSLKIFSFLESSCSAAYAFKSFYLPAQLHFP